VDPGDLPFSWTVGVRLNGWPDVSGLNFIAPLYDDGVEVGSLTVDQSDAANGQIELTLTAEVFAQVKRYSTWRLRETTMYRVPIMQGRLIKAT
jgi:hypothetical protein